MLRFQLSAFSDEAASSFDEQLRVLQEEGIGMTELRSADGKNCAALSIDEAKAIRRKLDAANIGLSALGSPYGKIGADQPFDEHFAAFLHGLDLCHELDCKRIRMFSFYIPTGSAPAQWRDTVLERMDRMLTAAEKAGVKLIHENEKGIYGDNAERCKDLLDHFGDRMGFAFDPANFIQCGVKPPEAYDLLHERITYMHIKDAFLSDGAVVCAGEGDGHVPELLRRLNGERSGDMILTVEPHLTVFAGLSSLQTEALAGRKTYLDARAAFHAAVSALKNILAKIEEENK